VGEHAVLLPLKQAVVPRSHSGGIAYGTKVQ